MVKVPSREWGEDSNSFQEEDATWIDPTSIPKIDTGTPLVWRIASDIKTVIDDQITTFSPDVLEAINTERRRAIWVIMDKWHLYEINGEVSVRKDRRRNPKWRQSDFILEEKDTIHVHIPGLIISTREVKRDGDQKKDIYFRHGIILN